jgi:hypothetical protein
MTNINTEQLQMIADALERDICQLHGMRYKGDRYVQPLHHHNYSANRKAHTRDKIRRS